MYHIPLSCAQPWWSRPAERTRTSYLLSPRCLQGHWSDCRPCRGPSTHMACLLAACNHHPSQRPMDKAAETFHILASPLPAPGKKGSPESGRCVVAGDAVLPVHAAGALRGELLSHVEDGAGQPPLQPFTVAVVIVCIEAPGKMLIVADGFVDLIHRVSCRREKTEVLLCPSSLGTASQEHGHPRDSRVPGAFHTDQAHPQST